MTLTNGRYKCLGINYPYNGLVYRKPRGSDEFVVGKCIDSIRIIEPDGDDDIKFENERIVKEKRRSRILQVVIKRNGIQVCGFDLRF